MLEPLCSVVIINWMRQRNVLLAVDACRRHPRVGQVVVVDCSPGDPFCPQVLVPPASGGQYAPLSVVRYDADPGLYARFAAAALCRQDPVLLMDDDIELPAETVTRLYDEWHKDTRVVHGIFGRQPTEDGTYTTGWYVHGPAEIVLTRAVMVSRRLCSLALAHGIQLVDELPGVPRGNGEDIVLSYTARADAWRLNQAHNLPFKNMGFDDKHAISVRWPYHQSHRTAVVRWCRQHFGLTK